MPFATVLRYNDFVSRSLWNNPAQTRLNQPTRRIRVSELNDRVKSLVANDLLRANAIHKVGAEDMGEDVIYGADPFHSAFYGTRMSMVISNPNLPDNPITFVNQSFLAMTGYTRAEIIGRNCRFLQGPDTDMDQIALMSEAIQKRKAVDLEILNYRKDGSTFWNALHVSPVFDRQGKLQYYFGSQIDVTQEREAREREIFQLRIENQLLKAGRQLSPSTEDKTDDK